MEIDTMDVGPVLPNYHNYEVSKPRPLWSHEGVSNDALNARVLHDHTCMTMNLDSGIGRQSKGSTSSGPTVGRRLRKNEKENVLIRELGPSHYRSEYGEKAWPTEHLQHYVAGEIIGPARHVRVPFGSFDTHSVVQVKPPKYSYPVVIPPFNRCRPPIVAVVVFMEAHTVQQVFNHHLHAESGAAVKVATLHSYYKAEANPRYSAFNMPASRVEQCMEGLVSNCGLDDSIEYANVAGGVNHPTGINLRAWHLSNSVPLSKTGRVVRMDRFDGESVRDEDMASSKKFMGMWNTTYIRTGAKMSFGAQLPDAAQAILSDARDDRFSRHLTIVPMDNGATIALAKDSCRNYVNVYYTGCGMGKLFLTALFSKAVRFNRNDAVLPQPGCRSLPLLKHVANVYFRTNPMRKSVYGVGEQFVTSITPDEGWNFDYPATSCMGEDEFTKLQMSTDTFTTQQRGILRPGYDVDSLIITQFGIFFQKSIRYNGRTPKLMQILERWGYTLIGRMSRVASEDVYLMSLAAASKIEKLRCHDLSGVITYRMHLLPTPTSIAVLAETPCPWAQIGFENKYQIRPYAHPSGRFSRESNIVSTNPALSLLRESLLSALWLGDELEPEMSSELMMENCEFYDEHNEWRDLQEGDWLNINYPFACMDLTPLQFRGAKSNRTSIEVIKGATNCRDVKHGSIEVRELIDKDILFKCPPGTSSTSHASRVASIRRSNFPYGEGPCGEFLDPGIWVVAPPVNVESYTAPMPPLSARRESIPITSLVQLVIELGGGRLVTPHETWKWRVDNPPIDNITIGCDEYSTSIAFGDVYSVRRTEL